MDGPTYRIYPHCMESCWHHRCNITIEIWFPHWITKRQPNKLSPSTMNFDVPPCGRLIWRVLPLLCVYPGMFLQQPSTNADGPLPCTVLLLQVHIYSPISPSKNVSATPPLLPLFLNHISDPVLPIVPISLHVGSLVYNLLYPLCSASFFSTCLHYVTLQSALLLPLRTA